MIPYDITLPAAGENLALDVGLLAGLPTEVLRFWELPYPAVILGNGSNPAEDVRVDTCRKEGVPIVRRASGGGTVVVGPGCLNFTLSLERRPELRDIRRSYRVILGKVATALGVEGVMLCGTSDLTIEGCKISGNAQKRTRDGLLHQGTILCNFDIDLMTRLLREPRKQPAYRESRPHAEFVRNIALPVDEVKSRLAAACHATVPATAPTRAECLLETASDFHRWPCVVLS